MSLKSTLNFCRLTEVSTQALVADLTLIRGARELDETIDVIARLPWQSIALLAYSIPQPAEHAHAQVIFAGFQAAEYRKGGAVAGPIQFPQEHLVAAFAARATGGQAGVVTGTSRTEVCPGERLFEEPISTEGW